jgi:hypothetical protein
MKNELLQSYELDIDGRTVFTLSNLDDVDHSSKVLKTSLKIQQDPKGFVFITHSQANRGVNIKGISPSCVIVNY